MIRVIRIRWNLTGLLILPIAELAVFLAIAAQIGVARAASIVLATSLAGAIVIGNGARTRRSGPGAAGEAAETDAGSAAVFRITAGILLLVPGFLTDVAAILLLIPGLQRRVAARLLRGLGEARGSTSRIVELQPHEWQRMPEADPGKAANRPAASHCPPAPAVLATPPESGNSASRVKEEP